jgi:hemerythrin
MPFMQWNDRLQVNIDSIDNQHKKLLGLINELYDAIYEQKGGDVVSRVLTEVVDYTDYHFKTEEELFRKYAYAEASAHVKEHEYLRKEAREFLKKLESGKSITLQTMVFLKDWLFDHIMKLDQQYAPYLSSKGVK